MQVINWTRIKGSTLLLAIVVSGLFTNCDWCGGPNAKGVDPDHASDGPEVPTTACGGDVKYYHYISLDDQACQLSTQNTPASCLYKVMEGAIQRCPKGDGQTTPLSTTEAFTIFWTICNYTDRNATTDDVKPYDLQVYQVDPNTMLEGSTPFKTFPFTQPVQDRCFCQDVGVTFNDGSPTANVLPVGTYYFRLDNMYETRNVAPYTRGCDAASYQKVSIQ